jgi:SAM-dependent methyltransferase
MSAGQTSQEYLEEVAASRHGLGYKGLCLELLQAGVGQRVVDLGCGPGVDLARLADAVGASGEAVGVDLDADALRQAQLKAPSARLIRSDVAHVHQLPDGSVDRIKTDRVLQHVADPLAVVTEVARLLVPGGRAVFCEPDWDTLVLDVPLAISRRYREFVTGSVIRNPAVGRQLARLSRSVGLTVENVVAYTSVMTDRHEAEAILGLRRVAQRALAAQALSQAEASVVSGGGADNHCLAAVSLILTVVGSPC